MRACIKNFEDMPPDSKCCDDSNNAMKQFCGTFVELNPKVIISESTCPYCGHRSIGKGFNYKNVNFSLRADMIDIDEGA